MPETTADRIAQLENELKARDRRIAELRQELDEVRDLVRRLEEQAPRHPRFVHRA